MNENLIVLLGPHPAADAQWAPADAGGRLLGLAQRGPLAAAAAMAGDRRVVALLPAEQLMLAEVALPGLRGARLRQAAPFALEDRLAADVERVHCALGPAGNDDRHAVAAIEHDALRAWLAALGDAGLRPAVLLPDCLALPWQDGECTVLLAPQRAMLRDGPALGFSCERELLEPMLDARSESLPATRVALLDDPVVPPQLAATPPASLDSGLLEWLAPQAVRPSLNLLQGQYAPRERRGLALGRWRVPAALAATALLLAVLTWLAGYRAVVAEQRELDARIGEIFSRVITDEPMVDPRAQVERRLGGAGGGQLLAMLAAVADGAAAVDGVEVSSLSYRSGLLEFTVLAQRTAQLDALRERVGAAGFPVSIDSGSSRGDAVEARLSLRGPA